MTERKNNHFDYRHCINFYETFKLQAFQNLNLDNPVVINMEEKLNETGQFFLINDLIELKAVYYSKGAYDFFGVDPGKLNPSVIYEAVHPADITRFSNARTKIIKMGMDVFNNLHSEMFASSTFKTRNRSVKYIDLLFQVYICKSDLPVKTAYGIQVCTDVTRMGIQKGFHYYTGTDVSLFRYPDKQYLKMGNVFSNREWAIIKLIANDLVSEQIAEQLFISTHTVNRHRQNILIKSGKRSTYDLIIELLDRGLL
jgi:DNA-binding CsgD family transcriptional regulator